MKPSPAPSTLKTSIGKPGPFSPASSVSGTAPVKAAAPIGPRLQTSTASDTDILYEFIRSPDLVQRTDEALDIRAMFSRPWPHDFVFAFDPQGTIEDLTDYWNRQVKVLLDNNAGILHEGLITEIAPDAIKRQIDIDALGVATQTRGTRPGVRAKKGAGGAPGRREHRRLLVAAAHLVCSAGTAADELACIRTAADAAGAQGGRADQAGRPIRP